MQILYKTTHMGKAGVFLGLPFFLLVAMGGGYYGGQWIDQNYGTKYANVIGIVLGLVLSLYEILRQLQRLERIEAAKKDKPK